MKSSDSQSTSAGEPGGPDAAKQGPPSSGAEDASPAIESKTISDEISEIRWSRQHGDEYRAKLLQNIKVRLPQLEALLSEVEDHWGMEDCFYRFYHGSFKVFGMQGLTEAICKELQALLPDRPLNRWFSGIVTSGTGHDFQTCGDNWYAETRAILEACFHAHFFLKLVCKYGRQLDVPPNEMPSGWAAVLYLFNLR